MPFWNHTCRSLTAARAAYAVELFSRFTEFLTYLLLFFLEIFSYLHASLHSRNFFHSLINLKFGPDLDELSNECENHEEVSEKVLNKSFLKILKFIFKSI